MWKILIIAVPFCLHVALTLDILPMVQPLLVHPTVPLASQRNAVTTTSQKFPIRRMHQQQQQQQWTKSASSLVVVLTGELRGSSTDDNNSNNDYDEITQAEYDAEIEELKSEVTKYLQLRKVVGADDIAKE